MVNRAEWSVSGIRCRRKTKILRCYLCCRLLPITVPLRIFQTGAPDTTVLHPYVGVCSPQYRTRLFINNVRHTWQAGARSTAPYPVYVDPRKPAAEVACFIARRVHIIVHAWNNQSQRQWAHRLLTFTINNQTLVSLCMVARPLACAHQTAQHVRACGSQQC